MGRERRRQPMCGVCTPENFMATAFGSPQMARGRGSRVPGDPFLPQVPQRAMPSVAVWCFRQSSGQAAPAGPVSITKEERVYLVNWPKAARLPQSHLPIAAWAGACWGLKVLDIEHGTGRVERLPPHPSPLLPPEAQDCHMLSIHPPYPVESCCPETRAICLGP